MNLKQKVIDNEKLLNIVVEWKKKELQDENEFIKPSSNTMKIHLHFCLT
jgi:hypothetical protein